MSPTKNKDTVPTLYHYWRSSCSWRVRWAMVHKKVDFQSKPINLLTNEQKSPEFLKINPGGFVPAIEVGGDIFGESLAILEWLEEQYPQNPLLPSSPLERMRVRQMCQMIASGTQPLQNLSVMRHHSQDPKEQALWAAHWIDLGLTKLEELVSQHAGTFCFGGNLSFADLCLVPQMYNAKRFNIDTTKYPTLNRIEKNCLAVPECEKSAPHNFENL